ncbi:hypothetical protein BCT96_019460 [Vibrio splendidus]|uniref:hypothetical protein n=1 Tax=Vibrio splendidus TaxID=29497 RepID=UPI000C829877|nr:hypothetical protein [Vibrio splendidus]PMI82014.1 hypothetical protein BCU37_01890 [Vibrio splendidus]PMK56163.1 hypothetical protein BCT96_19510 [Vibrio splendidus]
MGIEQKITDLQKTSAEQTAASQALSQEVAGKMGEIDKNVKESKAKVDGYVADHKGKIHPRSYTPNRLKNSQFEMVNGELAFWTTSGGLIIEELSHSHFFSWKASNPLAMITGIYNGVKKVDENVGFSELKYPKAIRITNPSTDLVASVSQKVTSLLRRDASADVLSSVLLQVESGSAGFRRGYHGHEQSYSLYFCADNAKPTIQSGTGDPLKTYNVLGHEKMVVVDRMVDAHTGIWGIYLQPQTSIILQAPMTYMSQRADIENDSHPSAHYLNLTTQPSTYIAPDGTAHYL